MQAVTEALTNGTQVITKGTQAFVTGALGGVADTDNTKKATTDNNNVDGDETTQQSNPNKNIRKSANILTEEFLKISKDSKDETMQSMENKEKLFLNNLNEVVEEFQKKLQTEAGKCRCGD